MFTSQLYTVTKQVKKTTWKHAHLFEVGNTIQFKIKQMPKKGNKGYHAVELVVLVDFLESATITQGEYERFIPCFELKEEVV